jgi:hypothetical protein
MGSLRMFLAALTVFMSGRGVLFGFFVLSVDVMVRRLQMMVCGGMMVRGSLMVMFNRSVFGLLGHDCLLILLELGKVESKLTDSTEVVYYNDQACYFAIGGVVEALDDRRKRQREKASSPIQYRARRWQRNQRPMGVTCLLWSPQS